jgi:hypothetical protein
MLSNSLISFKRWCLLFSSLCLRFVEVVFSANWCSRVIVSVLSIFDKKNGVTPHDGINDLLYLSSTPCTRQSLRNFRLICLNQGSGHQGHEQCVSVLRPVVPSAAGSMAQVQLGLPIRLPPNAYTSNTWLLPFL